jgi:microcystin-dependent protein
MSNYEATRYDFDGANITGIEGIPTATIIPWSDSSVPSGFLECNGANVSRSTYSALFAIISTTYGAGDGATTFGLPDLQDNVPVGKSGTKNLGSTGGANTVAASGTVSGTTANATLSTAQLASHSHSFAGQKNGSGSQLELPKFGGSPKTTGSTGGGQGHAHNLSATFSGTASSVVQPYLTLIYIIKT